MCLLQKIQVTGIVHVIALDMRQVAHEAGANPGFCIMKQLGVFLLPPGWDASPSHGYPFQ